MKNILKIQIVLLVSFMFLFAQYPAYNEHNISLYFEVTESAINQFLKTQVFPQPEGTYQDGGNLYNYKITLIQPEIEIGEGEIIFNSEIIGKVTLLGNTIRYYYPIEVTVSIPSGSISIYGISGMIQGIPNAINSIPTGPQWLKNLIINAYNNLEITFYPDKFIEDINTQIPDGLDININDFDFGWEALEGKVQFSITVPCESRAPFVQIVSVTDIDESRVVVQLRSNVFLRILNVEMFNRTRGQQVASLSTTATIPAPNNGEDVGDIVSLTIAANSGMTFASGTYDLRIVFGNEFGWFKNESLFTILQ